MANNSFLQGDITTTDIAKDSTLKDINATLQGTLQITGDVSANIVIDEMVITDISINSQTSLLDVRLIDVLTGGNQSNTLDTNYKQVKGNSVSTGVGDVANGTVRMVLADNQPIVDVSANITGLVEVNLTNYNFATNTGDVDNITQRVVLGDNQPIVDVSANITNEVDVNVTNTILDINLEQLNNNPISTGDGPYSSNTLRVVIANNQPAIDVEANITNTALDTNLNTFNGVTIDVDTGDSTLGTQRIVLANDQPEISTRSQSIIFNSDFQFDIEPLIYDSDISGNFTVGYNSFNKGVDFALTATDVGQILNYLSKKKYHIYNLPARFQMSCKPRSELSGITGYLEANWGMISVNSTTKLIQHGAWFSIDTSSNFLHVAIKGDQETRIRQDAFNINIADGNGIDNLLIDTTTLQRLSNYVIDISPMDTVTFGIKMDSNKINWLHRFFNHNNLGGEIMSTSNNNIGWHVKASVTVITEYLSEYGKCLVSASDIPQITSRRFPRSISMNDPLLYVNNTIYGLAGLKYGTGDKVFSPFEFTGFSFSVEGTDDWNIGISLNPVVNGTPVFAAETNSPMDSVSGDLTNTITPGSGGILMYSVAQSSKGGGLATIEGRFDPITIGQNDELWLVLYTETGLSGRWTINWKEGNFH